MVKIVGNKKPLPIVPILAAMQSVSVTVKVKIFFMTETTSRIPHHLLRLDLLFPRRVICRYCNK